MTMYQQQGDYIFECQGCGAKLKTETSNFEAAQNLMKRKHWKPKKRLTNWDHYCPNCKF